MGPWTPTRCRDVGWGTWCCIICLCQALDQESSTHPNPLTLTFTLAQVIWRGFSHFSRVLNNKWILTVDAGPFIFLFWRVIFSGIAGSGSTGRLGLIIGEENETGSARTYSCCTLTEMKLFPKIHQYLLMQTCLQQSLSKTQLNFRFAVTEMLLRVRNVRQ